MAKNMVASPILSAANSAVFYADPMEIGDRIRRERRKAGLTQTQLAARVSVDKSAVAQWESPANRKGITSPNLIKVAIALGIPVARLTGEDEGTDVLEIKLPDELKLIRLYRLMGPRQQRVHLDLFHTSVGIAHPEEPESDPSKSVRVAARRPVKQKT